METSPSQRWTLALTSTAALMVSLDIQVVTTALPAIRTQLHATLAALEWTVNAYTLAFAVLLLTGAALGERLGRGGCSSPGWRCSRPPRPAARWPPTRAPSSRRARSRGPGPR